ncbi:MAG: DNA-directed RNA polymerase, subunit E'' [Desulfurococcales archaeon]|nr:DNA-directed RNA polymerase, subunit E'' [Desulfurococcales archaeon]
MAGKPKLKACRNCGALVPRDVNVCPVCGGTSFTEAWEGMIVILDESSLLARKLGISKPGMYALKVSGRVVKGR